jgi:hypothetical protein
VFTDANGAVAEAEILCDGSAFCELDDAEDELDAEEQEALLKAEEQAAALEEQLQLEPTTTLEPDLDATTPSPADQADDESLPGENSELDLGKQSAAWILPLGLWIAA